MIPRFPPSHPQGHPMTDSTMERVAKAIGDECYGWVDAKETPNTWAISVDAARAALDAISVPTPSMLRDGLAAAAIRDALGETFGAITGITPGFTAEQVESLEAGQPPRREWVI